jgi:hypothetical protein
VQVSHDFESRLFCRSVLHVIERFRALRPKTGQPKRRTGANKVGGKEISRFELLLVTSR